MVLVTLMLRGGHWSPAGNYTILYDGEGEIDLSLVHNQRLYDGKGKYKPTFSNNIQKESDRKNTGISKTRPILKKQTRPHKKTKEKSSAPEE